MKVYKAHFGRTVVPEIRIKNNKLKESGFSVGADFQIVYENKRIVLLLCEKDNQKTNEQLKFSID